MDGMQMQGVPTEASPMIGESYQLNNAGEQIIPGSVQVTDDGTGGASSAASEAVEAATDGI